MRAVVTGIVLLSLTMISQIAVAVDIHELRSINQQVNLSHQRSNFHSDQRFFQSAVAKYNLVRQRFPEARMMIIHAKHITPSGFEIEPHTVIAVEANDHLWILDNELLNIYTAQERKDLKPITSIELRNGQVWIHQNDCDWSIVSSQLADSATEARLKSTFWKNMPG
jgi:predicted transglutaminase-like cysteine proteinase